MSPDRIVSSGGAYSADLVGDEMEAEMLCGRLRASGVECGYRKSDTAAAVSAYGGGFAMAGPTEVLVDERDLEEARKLLRRQ